MHWPTQQPQKGQAKKSKDNNCKIFSWLKKTQNSPNKQAPLQNPSHVKKTQKEKYVSLSESAIRRCFHEFKIKTKRSVDLTGKHLKECGQSRKKISLDT